MSVLSYIHDGWSKVKGEKKGENDGQFCIGHASGSIEFHHAMLRGSMQGELQNKRMRKGDREKVARKIGAMVLARYRTAS